VILEAIALGTPVVATNCTGALSEISSCTRHIAIVDSRQPEAISAAVISSLNKANPGSKGIPEREFVQRFHIATIVREYEEALSNVRVRV
jgi:glycosyltransferase involved in cell wall biosynthesis